METISERLKKCIELRGLKQADLVKKTGISKGALSSYISGRYSPKKSNLYLLAKALDVNEDWLMGADLPIEETNIISDPSPLHNIYCESKEEMYLILTYRKISKDLKKRALHYFNKLSDLYDDEEKVNFPEDVNDTDIP